MNPNDPRYIPVGGELPPLDADPPPDAQNEKRAKGKPKAAIAGRFIILNDFVDYSLPGLTRVEALTWFILWRDTKDGSARTSQSDIARRAGCAQRSVIRAIARLETLGLIKIIYRGGFPRRVSRYKVKAMAKD